MRPLECLIIPELAALQAGLERLGKPDELRIALDGYNDAYFWESTGDGRERLFIERATGRSKHSLPEILNVLFWWKCTPQGHSFWAVTKSELERA